MKIIKRSGKEVEFDSNKIITAINKAFIECGYNDKSLAELIYKDIESEITDLMSVEEIQNLVELGLMRNYYYGVAKAYITYRYKRQLARESKAKLMKNISSKLMAKAIENQNANVDEASFGGRIGEASRVIMKDYALNHCMSKMSRENHLNNEIYIHDLDSYAVGMHNCLSIPFDDLLAKGFNTRQTDVRPANSINTAFQLVAVIFQLQSLQQFGGVSATHLDWTMVPYVRKSFWKHMGFWNDYIANREMKWEMQHPENVPIEKAQSDFVWKHGYNYAIRQTQKELTQAVEGMYHNLNTLQSRSGNQLNKLKVGWLKRNF